ncbi:MAG TPA: DUF1858 domain-containing protein [Verrucomicrobiae bacterium]|nr:DUF1858 domain-containing protein [Verrucomicrobiae bacterium]
MITKDTPIMEVLQANPAARQVFIKHGMHCIGCLGSEFETIEMGAKSHDLDLATLLKDLNALEAVK